MKIASTIAGIAALTSACAMSGAARADDAADFYRGKTITLLSPDAAGSGYDAYARLVSRFIGEHIPGKPSVVVQNMPGAGGVIQANYIYNIAAKDGTAFAIIMHGTIFRPIFDPRQVRYKVDGFRWLGSVTPIVVIGAFRRDAPAKTVGDLYDKEVLVGMSGGTTAYLPQSINTILHTKMKLIAGYHSTSDILLAMDRREVAGVVGIGLDSIQTMKGANAGDLNIMFQMGATRSPTLPNVPLIQETARSDLDKHALEAIFASFSIGRVFVTPQIPDDRYQALRSAFEATVKDPAFVAAAEKQKSAVDFVSPQDIEKVIKTVYSQPDSVLKRATEAMMDGSK